MYYWANLERDALQSNKNLLAFLRAHEICKAYLLMSFLQLLVQLIQLPKPRREGEYSVIDINKLSRNELELFFL